MRILFQHPGIFPIKKYGGTERIIFWLMKELAGQGHEIFFIGHPKCDFQNYNINHIVQNGHDWRNQIPKNTDIIHLSYVPPFDLPCPYLLTVHGNARPGERFPSNTVFVSKAHANFHNSEHFVYNGLDFSEYPYEKRKDHSWSHFLFLAKASWKVKNLSACKKACHKTRNHLHIAGGRSFNLSPYIHSYGIIDQNKKLSLLRQTDALLFPVLWPEPFGIAIIEAFSQGLPVIGSTYGSLRELIQTFTGVLCNDYNEFENTLRLDNHSFDPEQIRSYAIENFSISNTAQGYLHYYNKILRNESFSTKEVGNLSSESPETLLPF